MHALLAWAVAELSIALGAFVQWVKTVMAPRTVPGGLGPAGRVIADVASFTVAALVTFRVLGVSVGSALSPFVAVVGSALWYAVAVGVCCGARLLTVGRAARRETWRACRGPTAAIGLALGLLAAFLLLVASDASRLLDDLVGEPDGSVLALAGGIILGLGLMIVVFATFVALTVGLVVALWYGARNRFRAAEVHPALAPLADVGVAVVLVATAVADLISTGSASLLLLEAASAAAVMIVAGIDLWLLRTPARPSTV